MSGTRVTLQVEVDLAGSMLEMESSIQDAVNEVGSLATAQPLARFDTDGSIIELGGERWSVKGYLPKVYQSPYGEVAIERHVYQRSNGGKDLVCAGARCAHRGDVDAAFCHAGLAQVRRR